MKNRYHRNRIYITDEEQEIIKNCPIVLGGSGIGSVIAECALRLGFENITIIDGDQVELTNLNRQNYTEHDVSIDKVTAIKSRLKAINKNASINVHSCFINKENVDELIKNHKIAINALDFTSDIPLRFDEICRKRNIPVLHPYNIGWGGVVAIVAPDGMPLTGIVNSGKEFNELDLVEYISSYQKFWGESHIWIDQVLKRYKEEIEHLPPPQLSIASWSVASICTHIIFRLALGKETKIFPEFYFSSLFNS